MQQYRKGLCDPGTFCYLIQTSILSYYITNSISSFPAETGACLAKMDIASVFVGNNNFQFIYISDEDNSTTWPREPLHSCLVPHISILQFCLIEDLI